jgi:hypothetical protein
MISFQKCFQNFSNQISNGQWNWPNIIGQHGQIGATLFEKNIKERYSRKNNLENRHVYEIFQQWLTAIRGNPPNEIMNALRSVVVEEFQHVSQNLKPLNQSKSDRFTIDLSLNSRSGYDIAASLNLAYDEVASSSEEDQQILHKKQRGGSRPI